MLSSALPRAFALAALAATLLPSTAAAQQPVQDAGGPLVYVFSLDGLDGDRVDQGRAPFFGRLLLGQEGNRATYYRESRAIMVAETNPNHTAMATGAYGDKSGIPGNSFAVYGAADRQACDDEPNSGSASESGGSGGDTPAGPLETDGTEPGCALAESFFTAAERQAPQAVTTAGIFGKPKLASIFATRRLDQGSLDVDHLWTPCRPSSPGDPDYCRGTGREPDGYALTDQQVMDEVVRTVDEGVDADGARKRPNLTFVNFPAIDSAGHALGTETGAYDREVGSADAQLQRFVDNQKRLGLWERTVVFLVSDHSMDTTPEKTSLTQRYQQDGVAGGVEVVQNGSVDMVYLVDRNRPDKAEFLKRVRESALKDQPRVMEALYREPNPADGGIAHTLAAVHPGWRIAGPRTGDLLVTHRTAGAFSEPVAIAGPLGGNPLTGNHGGPQTADNTFAIVSGGPQVRQQAIGGRVDTATPFDDTLLNPGSAENVDVAPSVLAVLGLQAPRDSEGRVLTEAFEQGALPAPAPAAGAAEQVRRCLDARGLRAFRATPRGRGLRFTIARRRPGRVTVDVFLQSRGRTVVGNRRVARFRRSRSFTWPARGVRGGVYVVRARLALGGGRFDTRRVVVRRSGGRFRRTAGYARPGSCGLLRGFKLERPVFGGRRNRPLGVAFRLSRQARVTVEVLRGRRVVRRLASATRRAEITHRLRLPSERLRRGPYRVRLTVSDGATRVTAVLVSRRL